MNQPKLRTCVHILVGILLSGALIPACQAPSAAKSRDPRRSDADGSGLPSDRKYDQTIAFLKIDEIKPVPQLPPVGTLEDETSARAQRQIDSARQLYSEKRYAEAAQDLERALRYSPNSFDGHILMATVCLDAGNSARAKDHLRKALEIQAHGALPHYLLGRAFVLEEAWQSALTELRLVLLCKDISSQPAIATLAHYYLAKTLENLGYLSAAIEQYEKFLAAQSDPEVLAGADADQVAEIQSWRLAAYLSLSQLYETLQRPAQAVAVLRKAIEYDANNPTHYRHLAELLVALHQYEEAADAARHLYALDAEQGLALLKSIRLDAQQSQEYVGDLRTLSTAHPGNAQLALALAEALVDQSQQAQAQEHLARFLDANPGQQRVSMRLAQLYCAAGDYKLAIDTMSALVAVDSDPAEQVDQWLAMLRHRGQLEPLLAALRGNFHAPGADFARAYLYGKLAAAAGDSQLAAHAFHRCVEQRPDFAAGHMALAQLQIESYQWSAALEEIRETIRAEPNNASAHRLLGQAYLGLDEYDQAEEALSDAIRLDRDDIEARHLLAEVHDLSGAPLKAKRQLQNILEIDPADGQALEMLFFRSLIERKVDQVRFYLSELKNHENLRNRFLRCQALLDLQTDQDIDAFISTMREIIAMYPSDVDSRVQLAAFLIDANREQEVLHQQIAQTLEIDPHQLEALRLRARMQRRDLDFSDAADTYRQLLGLHPNRISFKRQLTNCLIDDQKFEEAAALLTRQIEDEQLDPDAVNLMRYDLLMCLVLSGHEAQAIESVKRWLETEQGDPTTLRSTLVQLAALVQQQEQIIQTAEQWYQEASTDELNAARAILVGAYLEDERFADAEVILLDRLELDPDSPGAIAELLRVYLQADRIDEAIELARASAQDPRLRLDYQRQLVTLLIAADRHEQALRLIRELMSELLDEEQQRSTSLAQAMYLDLRMQLSSVLISSKQYDAAEHELTSWLEENPPGQIRAEVMRQLSFCYQLNGKQSMALQQLEALYEMDPTDPGINNDLGYTWAADDTHIDQAYTMIRLAVAANPRAAAYLDSMGWVYYKKGQFDEAYDWLSRAARAPTLPWDRWLFGSNEHEVGGGDAVIQNHLGDAAWRLGKNDQAVKHWQRAVDLASAPSDDVPTPEVSAVKESVPQKIAAAAQGNDPDIARSGSD